MSEAPPLTITHLAGEVVLAFPYDAAWVAAIQRLRLRRFVGATKRWHVPVWLAPELLDTLVALGAPEETLMDLRRLAAEALATEAGRRAASRQRHERVMPGLEARHPGLFAHQLEGVDFLLSPRATRGAILADDMGLGKTRQAIVAAEEGFPEGRVLVICPASVRLHWAREIGRVVGAEVPVSVPMGRPSAPARWLILSYDQARRHRATLARWPFTLAILDEAHYLKNPRALRTRAIVGGADGKGVAAPGLVEGCEQVWLLTGTPITNRPIELFPLLRALRHPLGDALLPFAIRYCAAFQTPFGWDMRGASALDELHEALGGVLLRRTKEELLDLPPKLRTYMPVMVDLDAYRQVWRDHVLTMSRRKRRSRGLILAEMTKLRQAAAIAKIPAARELLDTILAGNEKVVVFTCFQAVVDALAAHLGETAVQLTGAHDARQRQAAIDAFQGDPQVRVFIGNLQAAGTGVTLTAATQVVFVDYALAPGLHLQAEDRPHRIGQDRAVTVTYLSAVETLDEEVEALLAQKLAVIGQAVDGLDVMSPDSFLDDLLAVVERRAAHDMSV